MPEENYIWKRQLRNPKIWTKLKTGFPYSLVLTHAAYDDLYSLWYHHFDHTPLAPDLPMRLELFTQYKDSHRQLHLKLRESFTTVWLSTLRGGYIYPGNGCPSAYSVLTLLNYSTFKCRMPWSINGLIRAQVEYRADIPCCILFSKKGLLTNGSFFFVTSNQNVKAIHGSYLEIFCLSGHSWNARRSWSTWTDWREGRHVPLVTTQILTCSQRVFSSRVRTARPVIQD